MEFGEMLKELRLKKKMSQRDLASRVGINFTYLSKIEKGRMDPPSRKTIISLTEVLQASDAETDQLLILANKIPIALETIPRSEAFLQFLRTAGKIPISEKRWIELIEIIKSKGQKK